MIKQMICLLLMVGALAWPVHADELVLVDEGKSAIPIVVYKDAPPFTRQAADDLAAYIEKVSGVRPEVIEGQPDPLPTNAIWVGYQPALDSLFPKVDLTFEHPEEILIAANAHHLVIAGRDRWTPEGLEIKIRRGISGVQQEYGTANAVYTFLQDYLHVRWLWPGELGEDIQPQETIAFEPFEYRYHPTVRARAGVFIIHMLNRLHPGHEWTRYQRAQLDSMYAYGGHQFQNWWERFHKTHPEYFALQPDGTRGGGKKAYPYPKAAKICMSNPAVWQQWLADVEAELKDNPNATVFGAVENDGGYEGYCVCDNCRAWDNYDAPKVILRWQGMAQQYVSMADRQITFANNVARLLKERYPNKDYYVMAMAYGASTWAPVGVKPADNVIVSSVHSFHRAHGIHPRTNVDQRNEFLKWTKVADKMIWRPNIGQGDGWHLGTAVVAPRKAIEDMHLMGEHNIVGMWFDACYGHWATQGPHYYILAQMVWDLHADGEAILKDYMHRAYGPAAPTMTQYWDWLEQATLKQTMDQKPSSEAWDENFYKHANEYLDQASAQLADVPGKYARRIDFARAGLTYSRLLIENAALVQRWHESGKQDTVAKETAKNNWKQIQAMMAEYPFLANKNYVHERNTRMAKYVPDIGE